MNTFEAVIISVLWVTTVGLSYVLGRTSVRGNIVFNWGEEKRQ